MLYLLGVFRIYQHSKLNYKGLKRKLYGVDFVSIHILVIKEIFVIKSGN